MKRIKTITLIVMIFTTNSLYAEINNLLKGVAVNDATLNELSTTTSPNAFAYGISWLSQKSVKGGTVNAFIKILNSTDLYSLSSSTKLFYTNYDTRTLLANWSLTRWPYLNIPKEYLEAEKYFTPKSETVGDASYNRWGSIGCLSNAPLRYGNVLSTTENDIVLILNAQFFIFSPTYKRVVFEEYYDHSDWLYGVDANEVRADIRVDSQDQYISGLYTGVGAAKTGYRGYSKLFIGDYDKDGNIDILVWRKIYRSNNKSNTVKGFTLIRNEWQHFERDLVAQAALPDGVTGEVLPQPTDAATIQTWLSENQLTWTKGYPRLSECAGQEAQLIPEMHDPLLNDPEVLQ